MGRMRSPLASCQARSSQRAKPSGCVGHWDEHRRRQVAARRLLATRSDWDARLGRKNVCPHRRMFSVVRAEDQTTKRQRRQHPQETLDCTQGISWYQESPKPLLVSPCLCRVSALRSRPFYRPSTNQTRSPQQHGLGPLVDLRSRFQTQNVVGPKNPDRDVYEGSALRLTRGRKSRHASRGGRM